MTKAIASGQERRRGYAERGKPGRFDLSCRPHGGGHSRPCPWCERARLLHAYRERLIVADEFRQLRESD